MPLVRQSKKVMENNAMSLAERVQRLEEEVKRLKDKIDPGDKNEETKEESEPNISIIITNILHEFGVPAHLKGYKYLRSAFKLCIGNDEYLESVTKLLYPEVAEEYATTPSRVERAIRHAIEVSWDRGNPDAMDKMFGYTVSDRKNRPTNSEFIAMITDTIKLELDK